jgi:hypothetical protein
MNKEKIDYYSGLNDIDISCYLSTIDDVSKEHLEWLMDNRPLALFSINRYRTKFVGIKNTWLAKYQPEWCWYKANANILNILLAHNSRWIYNNEPEWLRDNYPVIFNRYKNVVTR